VPLSAHTAWASPDDRSGAGPADVGAPLEPAEYASPVYAAIPTPAPPVAAKRGLPRWVWFVTGAILVVAISVIAARVFLLFSPLDRDRRAEAPAARITSIFTEDMALAVSANPIAVGKQLEVTVTFTNTHDVDVQNLRVYLEEAGQPALCPVGETTTLVSDHEITPTTGETWTFVLEAVSTGEAALVASVSAERATDPPAPDLWRIGPLSILVEAQP